MLVDYLKLKDEQIPSGGGFDPSYQAVLDEATTQGYTLPSSGVQNEQNQMVVDAKATTPNIWNESDAIYVLTGDGDPQFKLINWKDPSGTKATLENFNGTVDENGFEPGGFRGNGTYIKTNLNLSTDMTNYTQNDASIFMDIVEVGDGSRKLLFSGSQGTTNNTASDTTIMRPKINHDGSLGPLFTVDIPGLFGMMRTDATTQKASIEVEPETTQNGADSAALMNDSLTFLGRDSSGIDSARGSAKIGFIILASNLSGSQEDIINTFRYLAPEYKAVLKEAMALGYDTPTPVEQHQQSARARALKAKGVWDSLDFFYWFEDSGDVDFKLINWLDPTGPKGAFGASGSPTFSDTGVQGDGVDKYLILQSTYNNMALANVSYSWSINTEQVASAFIFSNGGNGNTTYFENTSALQYIQSNGTSTRDTKDFSGTGIMGATLLGTSFDGYKEGLSFDNSTETAGLVADNDLYLFRFGSSYGDPEVGFFCGGAAYDQAELYNSMDPDAILFSEVHGNLTSSEETALTTFVRSIKEAGVWDTSKAIYPIMGATAAQQKWNLKDPRDIDAAFRITWQGSWTHTADGAQTDQSTSYAETHLNPTIHLETEGLFNLGFYNGKLTNGSNAGDYDLGALSGDWLATQRGRIRNPAFADTANAANVTDGCFYCHSRLSTTSLLAFQSNNALTETNDEYITAVTLAAPDLEMYFGGINQNGPATNLVDLRYQFVIIGDGLTLIQTSDLSDAVHAFQQALSRVAS